MEKDTENNNDDPSKGTPNNPLGLGDPNDRTLRRVERDIMVPQKLRDKAKTEKCIAEVAAFTECCRSSSIAMVIKCRTENSNLKACLTKWYEDKEFIATCTEEYLTERSEYRQTGVRKSSKRYIV